MRKKRDEIIKANAGKREERKEEKEKKKRAPRVKKEGEEEKPKKPRAPRKKKTGEEKNEVFSFNSFLNENVYDDVDYLMYSEFFDTMGQENFYNFAEQLAGVLEIMDSYDLPKEGQEKLQSFYDQVVTILEACAEYEETL